MESLRRIGIVFCALGLAIGLAMPARAGVDDFVFDSMDVEYHLSLGDHNIAQLTVQETLVAVFPEADQNRGIRRDIPDYYNGHALQTQVLSVTDENGVLRDFSVEPIEDFVSLSSKHPDDRFVHGRQTYVITYRQKWVVANFGSTDEFYWDVNGTAWAQPFRKVMAKVILEPALVSHVLTDGISCYQGPDGSNKNCDSLDATRLGAASEITFEANDLNPGENLTINVPFEAALFNTGNLSQVSGSLNLIALWVLAAVMVALQIWALIRRLTFLSGRKFKRFVAVQYEGPEHPSLAAVASVIESSKWKVALLAQAAVRGYLTFSSDDAKSWKVARTAKACSEPELKTLLAKLFTDAEGKDVRVLQLGRGVEPSEVQRISEIFDEHMREAESSALRENYYSHRDIKTTFLSWGVLLVLAGAMIWNAIALDQVVDAGFVFIPLLMGFTFSVTHWLMLATKRIPTQTGVDLQSYMQGLSTYIRMVDKDRIAFLQSPKGAFRDRKLINNEEVIKLYEEALPWAILLGLENQWSKVLRVYYSESTQPSWIPLALIQSSSVAQLSQSLAASLNASSNSGADDGGSSGGGGGGGGGGGI